VRTRVRGSKGAVLGIEAYRPPFCVEGGGPWLEEPKGRSADAGVAARPARTRANAKNFFTVVLHSVFELMIGRSG
jgi:hypothetical protein